MVQGVLGNIGCLATLFFSIVVVNCLMRAGPNYTHNKFSWYFLMFASCDRKLYTGQNYVMDAVVILMWKRVAYVLTSAISRPWKRNKVVVSRCSSLRFLKSRYSLLAKLLWKYVCLCFRVSYSLLYLRAWFLFFLCLVWIKLLMCLIIN